MGGPTRRAADAAGTEPHLHLDPIQHAATLADLDQAYLVQRYPGIDLMLNRWARTDASRPAARWTPQTHTDRSIDITLSVPDISEALAAMREIFMTAATNMAIFMEAARTAFLELSAGLHAYPAGPDHTIGPDAYPGAPGDPLADVYGRSYQQTLDNIDQVLQENP